MNPSSKSSIESEIRSILRRRAGDERRVLSDLTDLVFKAYEEGESDGRKQERRKNQQ